jgi:hypothetical protein
VTLGTANQSSTRITLANPSIVVDDRQAGELWADVSYCLLMCETQPVWVGPVRGILVTFYADRAAITDTGTRVTWTFTPTFARQGDPSHPMFGQFPAAIFESMLRSLQGAPITVGFDPRSASAPAFGSTAARGALGSIAGSAGSRAGNAGASRASAQASPTTTVANGLAWKVSELAWTGPGLAPAHAADAPAVKDPERGFVFPVGNVSYAASTGATAVDFLGAVTLGSTEPGGSRVRLANPSVVVDEAGAGTLLASVSTCNATCPDSWNGPFRVTVATFQADRRAGAASGNQVSWTVTPAYPLQGDPTYPTFGQFPQPFLNSLAPSLQEQFRDTADAQGAPSPSNPLKTPAPIAVSFVPDSPATAGGGAAGSSATGSLTWGVRESFRNYVQGPIARGNIALGGGAAANRDGTFQFPAAAGATRTAAAFTGTVRFTGHDGQMDMTIANPRVEISGTTGTLFVDVLSPTPSEGQAGEQRNVAFATLDLSRVRPVESAGSVSWSNVPAALTEAGSRAFGGNYRAGQAFDPISFTLRTTAAREGGSNP